MGDNSPYLKALVALKEQLQELYATSRNDLKQQEARWEEEKPVMQDLIIALTNTRDIIKGEQKKVHDQLEQLQQRMQKSAPLKGAGAEYEVDVVDLQGKLIDLNNKVLDIDLELQKMKPMLSALSKQSEERQIHETKLIVLQDTRRILQDEISAIRTEIFRRESSAKYEEDKKRANELGYGDLSHLQEQLSKTEARLDRAKQSLYFPEVNGYRFAGGSAGIYFGAKDLYISEISGRFSLACDIATKPDGSSAARLTVALSGASAMPERMSSRQGSGGVGNESPTVRRQPRAASSDSASSAPPTPTAARLQPSSSMPQMRHQTSLGHEHRRSTDSTAPLPPPLSTEAASSNSSMPLPSVPLSNGDTQPPQQEQQQQQQEEEAPTQQQDNSSNASSSGLWRTQDVKAVKGKAVMSFFNKLSDKKESLKQVMSQAAAVPGSAAKDMLSGLKKASEERARPDSVRAGFSKFTSALAQKKAALQTKVQQARQQHQQQRELLTTSSLTVRTAAADGAAVADAAPADASQPLPAAPQQQQADTPSSQQLPTPPPPSPAPSTASTTSTAPTAGIPLSTGTTSSTTSSKPLISIDLPAPPSSSTSSTPLPDALPSAPLPATEHLTAPTTRKGVHVTLLAEGVELIGEKGTKVPNVSIKEICLEVEAMMAASFEFSPVLGWQAPERLTFEVIDLERQVVGNSIPLPRTLIKTILNMVLPKVMSKVFLASLPNELGKYVLESDEAIIISGEFRMHGPQLASFTADLAAGLGAQSSANPTTPPKRSGSSAQLLQQQGSAAVAAQQARAALGLSEAATAVLVELFSGRACMLETPRPCSIAEVCKLYLAHHKSDNWPAMCAMWDAASAAIMSQRGLSHEEPFSFSKFMANQVAKIARKPVRVSFGIDRLGATIEVDSALGAVRDYFERAARELHASAKGRIDAFLQQPLEEQLEVLNLWHQTLVTVLRSFKARFRSAAATLLASADSDSFQAGLEGLHYEGPLSVQVPISLMMDSENFFGLDLKLPDPQETVNSLAHRLKFILENVMVAAFGKAVQRTTSSMAAMAAAASSSSSLPGEASTDETFHMLMDAWGSVGSSSGSSGSASRRSSAEVRAADGSSGLVSGVLESPLLGRLMMRKLSFALRLDERRVEEMLTYGQDSHMVGGLLGCFGNLLSLQLAYQEPYSSSASSSSAEGGDSRSSGGSASGSQQCMLSVRNNEVTRVRVDLESLILQSCISPEVATRLLHATALAVAYRFQGKDARALRTLDAFFAQLHEYTSREVLDLVAAISVKAESRGEQLRIALSGDTASGPGAVAAAAGQQVWPVYFVNDVNLLTVLDTLRLCMDY